MKRFVAVAGLVALMTLGTVSCDSVEDTSAPLGVAEIGGPQEVQAALREAGVGEFHRNAIRHLLDNLEHYKDGRSVNLRIACEIGRRVAMRQGQLEGIPRAEMVQMLNSGLRRCPSNGLTLFGRLGSFGAAASALVSSQTGPAWEPYVENMTDAVGASDAQVPTVYGIVGSHTATASTVLSSSDLSMVQAAGEVLTGGVDEYHDEPWAYNDCDPQCQSMQLESVIAGSGFQGLGVIETIIAKVLVVDAIGCLTGGYNAYFQGKTVAEQWTACKVTAVGASATALAMILM
jgi:hypothetical protein